MRCRNLALASFIFVGLLTGLTGCIEFESQTVTYAYDAPSDTLKIYQDYHGIFGGDNRQELNAEELEQLDSVLTSQRTFFFGNWISEISHNQLRDRLKEIKDPEYQKEHKLDPAAVAHMESLIKLLIEQVHVENGSFYRDQAGRLSGVQRVTVRNVSKLIAAGNVVIRDALKMEAADEKTSTDERRLYLKSIEQQQDYIKIEGNRITVSFPATRDQFQEKADEDKTKQVIEAFRKQGGNLSFANDEVIVSIGKPDGKTTSLTLDVSDKTYSTNLLNTIKTRSLLKADLDPKADLAEFMSRKK